MLLLDAMHNKHLDIADFTVLRNIAEEAGADTDRFDNDYENPSVLDKLSEDHYYAVNNLEIFGTPTFVFEGKYPVFLKIESGAFDDAAGFFRELMHIGVNRVKVLEIKRP